MIKTHYGIGSTITAAKSDECLLRQDKPRSVLIGDDNMSGDVVQHPKADPDNENHVAAPMPGMVSSIAVEPDVMWKTAICCWCSKR